MFGLIFIVSDFVEYYCLLIGGEYVLRRHLLMCLICRFYIRQDSILLLLCMMHIRLCIARLSDKLLMRMNFRLLDLCRYYRVICLVFRLYLSLLSCRSSVDDVLPLVFCLLLLLYIFYNCCCKNMLSMFRSYLKLCLSCILLPYRELMDRLHICLHSCHLLFLFLRGKFRCNNRDCVDKLLHICHS